MSTRDHAGVWREGNRVHFRIWAPEHERLDVVLFGPDGHTPTGDELALFRDTEGFFVGELRESSDRLLYKVRVDGAGPFPDPLSRSQPFGVHGPSELPALHAFAWTDREWKGVELKDLVVYEVHVGTATKEGTFDSLVGLLPHVKELGATAIELMPLASFPGTRNWGYDGVSLFAPQHSYGGPEGLKRFVDAAHRAGLAVIIDAVYNHFGPDGNYLGAYSRRYFTHRHVTPWGDAVNVDGEDAQPVRQMLLDNARMWIADYHADGLRLDATHAIVDDGPVHVLQEIAQTARKAGKGRRVLVIAEDERNEARLVTPVERGGYGLDAVWADDFHHELRRAFAGDHEGYFADFTGSAQDIARTVAEGWFYTGQYAGHYGRNRGTSPDDLELQHFVHCIQNHDQVGNRALGDRLGQAVDAAAFRAMSTLLLLSPSTPLLFMGQEWNASTPFLYFTDHNAELGRQVTEGRRREFKAFTRFAGSEVPDPQAEETFRASKLDWSEREQPGHREILDLYRTLLHLRRTHPALQDRGRHGVSVRASGESVVMERRGGGRTLTLVLHLRGPIELRLESQPSQRLLLSSEERRFGGDDRVQLSGDQATGAGPCALVFER